MTQLPDDPTPAAEQLLDALPYGVVAVNGEGEILRFNAPAAELVPTLGKAARTCRDLFSCQIPGGPCEHACFAAHAAGTRTSGPEVRIDTAGGIPTGALWVSVSPMADAGAVLHLRPGWRGDRRRRSEERWHNQPALRIRVLGRTEVESAHDSIEGDWLGQRPGQILKYLVCERGRVVMAEEIAEALWPDSGRRAVSNTRYSIHRLRTRLEPRRRPHDPPAFVLSRAGGYTLDRDLIWIDVDEFERALEDGRTAMTRLDTEAATLHYKRAVGLYRGALLADEPYADWVGEERIRLAGAAANALRVLSVLAHEAGDHNDVVRHLQHLARLEPLDSLVHRELVQALLGRGRRSDAKRHYDTFAQRLRRQLGQEPEFDLRSLSTEPRPSPSARRS